MSLSNILFKRSDADDSALASFTPLTANLLIALFVLSIISLLLTVSLIFLRAYRRRQAYSSLALPTHNGNNASLSIVHLPGSRKGGRHSHRRTLSITTTPATFMHNGQHKRGTSITITELKSPNGYSDNDKEFGLAGDNNRLSVPEIRITFPDEEDRETGKRSSGRVVVVRIGDKGGVGLEPYVEVKEEGGRDGLPAYEVVKGYGSGEKDQWKSLDLESLGGLKEKSDAQTSEKRWG